MERRNFLGALLGALAMPSVPAAAAPIAPVLAADAASTYLFVWGPKPDTLEMIELTNSKLADMAWED